MMSLLSAVIGSQSSSAARHLRVEAERYASLRFSPFRVDEFHPYHPYVLCLGILLRRKAAHEFYSGRKLATIVIRKRVVTLAKQQCADKQRE